MKTFRFRAISSVEIVKVEFFFFRKLQNLQHARLELKRKNVF